MCIRDSTDKVCKQRKCKKKYSEEKKKQCKKTCNLCEGLPPSAPPPPPTPPPACRDNDIPGFGSLFCILNTDAKYVTESDKEDFCNDPHYKNKCMLTCGACEP